MAKQQVQHKGFTIIEVVLVLAIAALIFLMVFIALPALQRSQRDSERKEYLGKVTSSITTYMSNKRNIPPTTAASFAGYMDASTETEGATKPSTIVGETDSAHTGSSSDAVLGDNYLVTVSAYSSGAALGKADTNIIQVFTGAKCNNDKNAAEKGLTRGVAAIIQLENGHDFICQDI